MRDRWERSREYQPQSCAWLLACFLSPLIVLCHSFLTCPTSKNTCRVKVAKYHQSIEIYKHKECRIRCTLTIQMHTQIQDSEIYKYIQKNSNNFIDRSSRREDYNPTIWSSIILPAWNPSSPHTKKDHPTISSKRNQQHFLSNYKIPAPGSLGWGIHI